jgi:hypothetical protein
LQPLACKRLAYNKAAAALKAQNAWLASLCHSNFARREPLTRGTNEGLEATPGIEPGYTVLQTVA